MRVPYFVLVAVAVAGTASCHDTATSTALDRTENHGLPIRGGDKEIMGPPTHAERLDAERIGRAVAVALTDPDTRRDLYSAFVGSAVKEQKLHFASFLAGRGKSLLESMEERGMIHPSEVGHLISRVRDLEFYMPVEEHRRVWDGTTVPRVVIGLDEAEAPVAYDHNGESSVLSRVHAPLQPVLVLASVETDFTQQIALNAVGVPEISCDLSGAESLSQAHMRCRGTERRTGTSAQTVAFSTFDTLAGVYIQELKLDRDECGGECWWVGDPEYELHTFGQTTASTAALENVSCAGSTAYGEEYFDMNGTLWGGLVRVLSKSTFDQIRANGDSTFVIQMWEDDYQDCTLRGNVHQVQILTALYSAGIWTLAALSGNPAGYAVTGLLQLTTLPVFIASDDDFVGLLAVKHGTPFTRIGSQYNFALVRPANGGVQLVGRARVALISTSGVPMPGPIVRLELSVGSNMVMLPNTGITITAVGFDALSTAFVHTTTWSSSNPSVLSVNSSGYVSALSLGTADITATMDGMTKTIRLEVAAMKNATLTGPTYVQANVQNTWSATVDGGTAPFTYEWFLDGLSAGGNTAQFSTAFAAHTSHTLLVRITDRNSQAAESQPFAVNANGGNCAPNDPNCEEYRIIGGTDPRDKP